MKAWLDKLTRREQSALLMAALTVVGFSLYFFFWQPMHAEQSRLRVRLKEQTEALAMMQQAAQEVGQLGGEDPSRSQERTEESLLALVDRTARETIVTGIDRLEPDGEHAVKLWLKDVRFDMLAHWLQELQTEWGIQASLVSLHRAEQPGLVTGRLVMEEAAD